MPPEYCDTFEPMYMYAPKTPYKDVKAIIESELGKPIFEIFSGKKILFYIKCNRI